MIGIWHIIGFVIFSMLVALVIFAVRKIIKNPDDVAGFCDKKERDEDCEDSSFFSGIDPSKKNE